MSNYCSRCGINEDEFDRVRERISKLEAALSDAVEMVGSWGAYASEYFQDKHNLARDIAALKAALGSSVETIAEPPLEYVRCPNWPCVLPHRHIGPCTTSDRGEKR